MVIRVIQFGIFYNDTCRNRTNKPNQSKGRLQKKVIIITFGGEGGGSARVIYHFFFWSKNDF